MRPSWPFISRRPMIRALRFAALALVAASSLPRPAAAMGTRHPASIVQNQNCAFGQTHSHAASRWSGRRICIEQIPPTSDDAKGHRRAKPAMPLEVPTESTGLMQSHDLSFLAPKLSARPSSATVSRASCSLHSSKPFVAKLATRRRRMGHVLGRLLNRQLKRLSKQEDVRDTVVQTAVESSIDLFDKPLLNIATSALAHMDPALAMLHEAPMKTALISLERVMMTLGGPFMVDLVRFVSGITYYITHIKY